ncbi:unnamed protein product, partial [Ixodes pacificus]
RRCSLPRCSSCVCSSLFEFLSAVKPDIVTLMVAFIPRCPLSPSSPRNAIPAIPRRPHENPPWFLRSPSSFICTKRTLASTYRKYKRILGLGQMRDAGAPHSFFCPAVVAGGWGG